MVRRTRTFALPVAVALASFVAACSDSTPTTGPETTVADVDDYLLTLPSWDEFAAPVPDDEVIPSEPSFYEQSGGNFCSVKEASITRNPEDIVTYSPDSEILWLGSLIQGRHHRDGLGSLLELPIRQRGPLTVSIDLLFADNTRTIAHPTLASVSQAIGELIDGATRAGHKSGSSIFFNQIESHSLEQSALALGLSVKYMGYSVRSSLQADRSVETSTLMATFVQKMFTTSMVLPQTPRDVFGPTFTEELLQEQIDRDAIGPDNLPVYVGSITWGRMLTVTMTSTNSVSEMKAALSASASFPVGSASVNLSAEQKAVLDSSEIKVVAIGGHAQAAIDLIRTGQLGEYFKEDALLTTARPISYVLRNLGDNSIAKVSETTEYAIRECEAGGVQRYSEYTAWRDAAAGAGLVEDSLLTTEANVTLATELTFPIGGNAPIGPRVTYEAANTGLGFGFYLEASNAQELVSAYDQSWTLVFRDQEFYNGQDRWISIGDVDGISTPDRVVFEDDDFEIHMLPDPGGGVATVYAFAVTVGNNVAESGESITVRGDGFDVRLEEPWNGFIGLIAPFPITSVLFDESRAGGDDIAIRDFYFGSN